MLTGRIASVMQNDFFEVITANFTKRLVISASSCEDLSELR